MDAPRMPIISAVTQLRFDHAFATDFDATAHAHIETTFCVSDSDGHEEVFDRDRPGTCGTLLRAHQVEV